MPYSEDRADRAVAFINALRQSKGTWASKPVNLRTWQEAPIRQIFGTLNDDGTRTVRTAFWMLPRKNGKSTVAAAVALYLLFADGEQGGEVYGCGADRDQASIVFASAVAMIRQSPALTKRCEIIDSRRTIYVPDTGSVYRAIAADAAGSHGFDASAVIFDEVHSQRTHELWNVMRTSGGSRRQPLTFAITTAGIDLYAVWAELLDYCQKLDKGLVTDPTFHSYVLAAPEDADWTDEKVWKTVNPAAGDFRSLDEMRQLCTEAKQSPSLENAFRRLYLNQRTPQEVRWMPMRAWDECGPAGGMATPDAKALEGRRCVAGLDLSQVLDMTAIVLLFPMEADEKQHQVLARFWIPEAMIAKRADYQAWVGRGLVRVCPGETIDYAIVRKDIQELAAKYRIEELAYDPWNSTMLTGQLANEDGMTVRPVGQSTREMGAPMQELMRLILAKEINHGGNEVLRSCADAVIVVADVYGNIRPSKKKSSAAGGDRIDGITALTLAIDALMRAPLGETRITWIGG